VTEYSRLERRFIAWAAVIVVMAWLLREQFILFTQVDAPIRGDVRQYVAYAWNLLHHHTFSIAEPGSAVVISDAFRGPGYPLFLAGAIALGGEENGWYAIVLQAQAVLGAATVLLTMLLARHWLSRGGTYLAGSLTALWPHHIAATGAVLSEVLFGFLLVLALWLTAEAIHRRKTAWAVVAGITFGIAYLVNPIILLFPPLAGLFLWRQGMAKPALWLALLPLAFAASWGIRNAAIPDTPGQPGRAALNFVEGSWPQYHAAHNFMDIDPIALQISRQITAEEQLFGRSTQQGLTAMTDRMKRDPAYYASWYLFRKPWLLWDWNIRIGWGDVYYQKIQHSPLDVNPLLRSIKLALHFLNPLIFLLAAATAIIILTKSIRTFDRNDTACLAVTMVSLFFVYVTLMHNVFQAEPRYSIPYRPMEILLAVTAIMVLTGRISDRIQFNVFNSHGHVKRAIGQ
jgi:4-amino-4-deoxy-L-arabinose transferase-like glycosyltransferase